MFTALRDLFYNLFPINLPGIWWILSERWSPPSRVCWTMTLTASATGRNEPWVCVWTS